MMATPYTIDVPPSKVDNILQRVTNFPWSTFTTPAVGQGDDWQYGPPASFMRRFCQYWAEHYDWSQRQARMNTQPHFKVRIDGLYIHFVHLRGSNATNLPVLLLHGWPYSFHSFHDLSDRLANPQKYGGSPADGRDVVIPSMPGYDLSSAPRGPIGPRAIATMYNRLMTKILGYQSYVAHGGDWGSYVAEVLGFDHSQHCVGIHLTMLSVRHHRAAPKSGQVPPDANDEERAFTGDELRRWTPESAYARLQSTKPSKLGYAMADSPVGVAAWIIEAFHAWSDLRNREFEDIISWDNLLDEIMLYLVTDSFHTSTWLYVGEFAEGSNTLPKRQRIEVPVGILSLPDPVFPMLPRAIAERSHNVVEYTVSSRGGHFPFYEAREELEGSLHDFLTKLDASSGPELSTRARCGD